MKITEKLKEVLSAEDLKQLEDGIDSLVQEAVEASDAKLKVKYEKASQEFVDQKVAEKTEELKTQITEEYSSKMEEMENHLVEKFDAYLDSEISEKISDEKLQKAALTEVYQPIVEGIQNLFEQNYIKLNSEGQALLESAKAEIETLKKQNSELIAEKVELTQVAEKAAIKLLINEKTEGMTSDQKQMIVEVFEGKTFDEIESKIDSFVDRMIEEEVEKENKQGKETIEEGTEVISEQDGTEEVEKGKIAPTALDQANAWM